MSIKTLQEGGIYRVTKGFTDYHGTTFEAGRTFTFLGISYSGYDDGITLNCTDTRIDFREHDSDALIRDFSSYIEKIGHSEDRMVPAPLPAAPEWTWWEIAGAVALVASAIAILAIERPKWSGAYVSAWVILGIAAAWGLYAMMKRRRRK